MLKQFVMHAGNARNQIRLTSLRPESVLNNDRSYRYGFQLGIGRIGQIDHSSILPISLQGFGWLWVNRKKRKESTALRLRVCDSGRDHRSGCGDKSAARNFEIHSQLL